MTCLIECVCSTAWLKSPMKRLSTIAWLISARSITVAISRTQQRHGRNHHAPGLEHAEPRREDRVAVGPAQQHAVARDEAVLLDQQPRDTPGEIVELGTGPAPVIIDDRQSVRRT